MKRYVVTWIALWVSVMALLGPAASVLSQSGNSLLIKAYTCETDPGAIGMGTLPDDCAIAYGVGFAVATEDGNEVGSCVTDDVLDGCVVEVPLGTAIVVTEDVATVPAAYIPTKNPQVRQTPAQGAAGEFIQEFINVPIGDEGGIASGGIGLTRATWEAEHGPGELVDPAAPVFGELYAYEDGTYVVAFEGSKTEADDVVMYIEVAWDDAGISFEDAQAAVGGLLPTDATITEAYFAPPSPGGPMALNTFRYAIPSLATVPYGTGKVTPNVLVTYHERIETTNTGHQIVHEEHVTRVSIMAQIPPG